MFKSLKLCEGLKFLDNQLNVEVKHRVGMIHYRIASLYHNSYRVLVSLCLIFTIIEYRVFASLRLDMMAFVCLLVCWYVCLFCSLVLFYFCLFVSLFVVLFLCLLV